MSARRLAALIFNLMGSVIPVLYFSFLAVGSLNIFISVPDVNPRSRLAGIILISFLISAAIITLDILNVVHYIRNTKNINNLFDKYTIALGIMNSACNAVCSVISLAYIKDNISTVYPYGKTAGDTVLIYVILILCFLMSILPIILGTISIRKDTARIPVTG